MKLPRARSLVAVLTLLSSLHAKSAEPQGTAAPPVADFLLPSADEPKLEALSLPKAADSMDRISLKWIQKHQCGSCHTGWPCMMSRAALADTPSPALAIHDAQTTGRLAPITRQALDRMWTLQRKDGAWSWPKCSWPPFEIDDYYGAVLAAVAVGHAPENYAQGGSARAGVERLCTYFKSTAPPSLHHKAWFFRLYNG